MLCPEPRAWQLSSKGSIWALVFVGVGGTQLDADTEEPLFPEDRGGQPARSSGQRKIGVGLCFPRSCGLPADGVGGGGERR